MEKILISRCLMGDKVRYDAQSKLCEHPMLQQWLREDRLVFLCPEVAGGLSTPRDPAEIKGGADGFAVLQSLARVETCNKQDVTEAFVRGAKIALELVKKHQIKVAILKANSPSCGNEYIYDGSFAGIKIPGQGVTAALLTQNGVQVFNEAQIELVAEFLNTTLVSDTNSGV